MTIEQVTKVSDVQDILKANKYVVIDFMAKWCGPCKTIAPKINKLADQSPSIKFIKVDVDVMDTEFIESEEVTAMPTFKFYKEGEAIDTMTVVGADFNMVKMYVGQFVE